MSAWLVDEGRIGRIIMGFPPKVREDALVACGRHCCICDRFRGLKIELHHIVQVAEGGEDTFDNCIPLCFDCHADMRSYDSAHPKGTKYTPGELRGHRDRWYAKVSGTPALMSNEEQPSIPLATLEQEELFDQGYHLTKGHTLPKGVLRRPLTPPLPCGASQLLCVERIESCGQLQIQSKQFAIRSDDLREAIASAAGCLPDDIEETWSMVVGPPHTHLVVAVLDRQLVVLRIDFDGRSFATVDLMPPFLSPPRYDTRAAATVDILHDGGRQLLLASDGLSGSGLGQTLVSVYRFDGGRLAGIFEDEISFNMHLDLDGGTFIEERSTTFQWGRGYGTAEHPRILAITTHTLGELRSVRAAEYEWNGTVFHSTNHLDDAVAAREEKVQFEAEELRLRESNRHRR